MSGVGNCYDNANAEAFFSTLKTECFPLSQCFESKAQARSTIFEHIKVYYNNQRLHSALGYQSLYKFETQFIQVIDNTTNTLQTNGAEQEDRALRGAVTMDDASVLVLAISSFKAGLSEHGVSAVIFGIYLVYS